MPNCMMLCYNVTSGQDGLTKDCARMPLKSGMLTPQERVFIDAYAEHGDRARAEKAAGYRKDHSYTVLARPEIQRQITAKETARLYSEALPAAVSTLIQIAKGDRYPAAARVQAAKEILNRTLGADTSGPAKELHEMTPDEISQAIRALESQAAAAAVDVTPSDPGDVFA